ncbi:cytochrome ubiquinol oxidase subunit I [Candidatus Poribacteria bacterium]|nr:cytochrome ubiquinol oxidase subunit I [Candidatus Poribacteria bacterium]
MDFPVVEVPLIGGRMLIALVGIIHVLISHGCAVGGSFFLVLLEYKSIRERNERLNLVAYRLTRWFFILTTSVGAMTGVGIWFTTNMFSPVGIGSLLRVFFWAWFVEWLVFITEIVLVAVYYLSWRRMSPQKHLRVGIAYILTSLQTMIIIVGILGFQLTSGKWMSTRSFWDGFFNPTYVPQLFSRIALAGILACAFCLLIYAFLRDLRDVRTQFLRFSGAYLLFVSPLYLLATFAYYQVLPERAQAFISVALVTLQLTQYAQWSKIFFVAVVGVMLLTGAVLFLKQRTYGVLSILPILVLTVAVAQFERVREFARKPYVVDGYLYSNGFRKVELPFISDVGASRYATWAWRGLDQKKGDAALGHMLFRLECSTCHTYRGINGIFRKKILAPGEEAALRFLNTYEFSHPYMPPFAGTQSEKEALAYFLGEGATKK